MNDLGRKVKVGALWNLGNLLFSKGATTLFTLLLAKFISPEAFGLVAMATIVFELANALVQSGLGQALIRAKSVTSKDLSTVFISNLAFSLIAYLVIFLTAPYVASFYDQPALTIVVQLMGLVVLINATKIVQLAVLCRAMNFKAQMKANTVASILSGVLAIVCALNNLGVWSLVIMLLAQALFSSVLLWLASPWRPELTFSFSSFNSTFKFGKHLMAEGGLEVIFQNSYILVIGKFFSAEVTGLYFFAKKISNLISQQLTSAVQQVTFPALSTMQEDNQRLLSKYRRVMQLLMFIIAPIMFGLAAFAPIIFQWLLNEDWFGAIPYLQLLCVVGALYPLHALNVNLLKVKGRTDLIIKVGLVKKTVNIILLFVALPYGVIGIAVSQIAGSALALIPNTYFASKLINYSFKEQITDAGKPFLAALVSCILTLALLTALGEDAILSIVLGVLLSVSSFFLCCNILKTEALHFISYKIKKMWLK